jgi:hypothetical protein
VGARRPNFLGCLFGIVDRKDKNFGSRPEMQNLAHGCQSIQNRHVDMENYQIRA